MGDQPARSFPWVDQWPEIYDPRVRAAFTVVPRRAFIDEHLARFADQDAPLPIGEGQTISQPFVVALMVQALALQPGEKVLEIGAGSGFQTAILCELTMAQGSVHGETVHRETGHGETGHGETGHGETGHGETGHGETGHGDTVYAIERHPALADRARAALARLGYAPHLRVGDGALGWPEAAPFAAIIVSAVAPHVPRPLWEQLAKDGRLILPVGAHDDDQELWLVRKRTGVMEIERLGGVRFVPLVSPLFDDPAQWAEG